MFDFLFSKHTKTLSNTNNYIVQRFLFADFNLLNLALDLKVGVPGWETATKSCSLK